MSVCVCVCGGGGGGCFLLLLLSLGGRGLGRPRGGWGSINKVFVTTTKMQGFLGFCSGH